MSCAVLKAVSRAAPPGNWATISIPFAPANDFFKTFGALNNRFDFRMVDDCNFTLAAERFDHRLTSQFAARKIVRSDVRSHFSGSIQAGISEVKTGIPALFASWIDVPIERESHGLRIIAFTFLTMKSLT